MQRIARSLILTTLVTASAFAQSNVVSGLDGAVIDIGNLTYWGRRGPTNNGEVGMSFRNEMCNPGSVNIPWYAAMQPNHPWFGFIIARVHNDRIEQINEWSFCKHAWLSLNYNTSCGNCNTSTPGNLMGVGCGDAYGAGNNANRNDLGPPEEIDPWLGTWDPVGSYFDIGDPNQAGYPAPADGNFSLSTNIFDSVDNRCTVKEADMLVAGAEYYYALHLVLNGEAVQNRGDNLAHRGFQPNQSGGSWFFQNTTSMQLGTVLSRWQGATIESGGNGNDDGRFFVASKVTPLGGGQYHFEYAIHNVDNSRGGASFEVPIDAAATASNFTFGDLDDDASNDWTAQRVGNRIVFSAPAGQNALEWNTIYNFGFDADVAPGVSMSELAQARPGPGAATVQVQTEVPGGTTIATFGTFGAGCPGSATAPSVTCPELNANGGNLTGNTNQYEYTFRVTNSDSFDVDSFEIYTQSNSGTITRPAHIYAASGNGPSTTPLASTTITVGPTAGFYTATFATPVPVSGTFYIGYENSPGGVISNLSSGSNGAGFYRNPGSNWNQSGLVQRPSWRVNCTAPSVNLTPAMSVNGLPQLGSTYNPSLSDALANTFAILVSGLSDQVSQGLPLPLALPGAPGCDLLVASEALDLAITDANGAAMSPMVVPNNQALTGLAVYHQWAVWDPSVNNLSIVMSNGGVATIGN
ncbi:MAG: hypothetical protein KAI24_06630 [Planctomycetes bacterium]|nr:hypothetical protein [Planctomycetota bacterium]